MTVKSSRQCEISKILGKIASISDTESYMDQYGTGIAESGDLLFIITYYKNDIIKDSVKDVEWIDKIRAWMMGLWKPWAGFERDDSDDWHVGIYLIWRKRKAHNRKNIWMIHSIKNTGVNFQHINTTKLYK